MNLSDIAPLNGVKDQKVHKSFVLEEKTTAVLFVVMRDAGAVGAVVDAMWDFPLRSIFVVAEKQI
jgi:hypothetical protein